MTTHSSPALLLCITAILLVGCKSTFQEKHFFKSVDAEGDPINYYRLTVDGHTLWSSSRYLSGYFDEQAVDAYFSQIAQPAKASFTDEVSRDAGDVQPLEPGLENRKLVLLLSSNSDAIAEQIGQFANNQTAMADLTRLIYRDRIVDARDAQAKAALQDMRGKSLANLGERLIAGLPSDADQATTEANLLFYLNRLGAEFGSNQPFRTLPDAKTWLEYNRARLLEATP